MYYQYIAYYSGGTGWFLSGWYKNYLRNGKTENTEKKVNYKYREVMRVYLLLTDIKDLKLVKHFQIFKI